ncbi:MAG: hypothetical protein J6Y56_02010, partial [Fibrobacterales bacterium]|nr:hypothetical protein [Fibrobacterales bacterium]
MKVPFCQIARDQAPFEDELLAAAARVVRGGRWIGGPEVEALERELGVQLFVRSNRRQRLTGAGKLLAD